MSGVLRCTNERRRDHDLENSLGKNLFYHLFLQQTLRANEHHDDEEIERHHVTPFQFDVETTDTND